MASQVIKEIKGVFFVECLNGESYEDFTFNDDDYGVFFTGSTELGIEGHCYFYGCIFDANIYADERNEQLKDSGNLE